MVSAPVVIEAEVEVLLDLQKQANWS